MLKTRIIPCLDVIKNKVVKGVNFKNIRVMGNKSLFLSIKFCKIMRISLNESISGPIHSIIFKLTFFEIKK